MWMGDIDLGKHFIYEGSITTIIRLSFCVEFGSKMHKFPCLAAMTAHECNAGQTTNGSLLRTGRERVVTLKIKVIFNNDFMF